MLSRVTSSILQRSHRLAPALSSTTTTTMKGAIGAVRHLNVHEHISMEIFNEHGITTPDGHVAFTPEEAKDAYEKMGNRKLQNN